ncbi:SIR2 family protein [Leifsonia poae]|uniref:SIR2 family protein n=1 Tax=Leifsonia poae TaxID=110933 RepID=UPI001CBDA43E|nr:SIR2 family protein [Leifsonia poae]
MATLASTEFHQGCAVCGTHFPVDIPTEIVAAARSRNLVVFAGAGISTEAPGLFPETFYEEIEARLRDEPSGDPFPTVMQEFEYANGRRELIRTLTERIDYISTFRSLQNRTTAFHQELATIAQLDAIFTTNWDDFFERFAGARPFVLDEDFAFFDTPGRRVMKVHGSISNLSTIVATTNDYARREADLRESIMGAKLREFLSTKTLLFVGYSLSDSDFLSVYRSVIERMGAFRAPGFVVTPLDTGSAKELGLTHLKTDGGHFLHLLKSQLEQVGEHVPDERLERAAWVHPLLIAAHSASESMLEDANSFGCFTQSYQDGLLAALGRVGLLRPSGTYSEPRAVEGIVHSYSHLFEKAVGLRRYFDASYIEGYLIGTRSLLLDDDDFFKIPIVQTFSSPTWRARTRDPHLDADSPWWIASPTATLRDYLATARTQESAIAWLADNAISAAGRARRTPGLSTQNRELLASLRPGQVPQHTEFLDGI